MTDLCLEIDYSLSDWPTGCILCTVVWYAFGLSPHRFPCEISNFVSLQRRLCQSLSSSTRLSRASRNADDALLTVTDWAKIAESERGERFRLGVLYGRPCELRRLDSYCTMKLFVNCPAPVTTNRTEHTVARNRDFEANVHVWLAIWLSDYVKKNFQVYKTM